MGVNKGSSEVAKAIIQGHVGNPFAKESKPLSFGWQIVIIIFIVLFISAIVIFVYQNRKLDRKKSQMLYSGGKDKNIPGESKPRKTAINDDTLDESLVDEDQVFQDTVQGEDEEVDELTEQTNYLTKVTAGADE